MSDKVTLREKFKVRPFEWSELKPYIRGHGAYFLGTRRHFGILAAITQMSPLANFIEQALRGFPYRHCSLAVDGKNFPFGDRKGNRSAPSVVEAGR